MKTIRRGAAALTTTIAALTFGGVTTAAPETDPIELICDGVPGGEIATTPNDSIWTPAFLVSEKGLLMPYHFEVEVVFHPDEGDPITLESEVHDRPAPRTSHASGSCTASGSERIDLDDFAGVVVYQIYVEGFWTAG